jgi:hypothetical protein
MKPPPELNKDAEKTADIAVASGTLTAAQKEILIFGRLVFEDPPQPPYQTESQERADWIQQGERLTAETQFRNRRPHGFFKYDLLPLLEAGRISSDEAARIDDEFLFLDADQKAGLMAVFADETEVLRRAAVGVPWILESRLAEFQVARRWHAFRGRPLLAEKYERLCSTIEKVIEHTGLVNA